MRLYLAVEGGMHPRSKLDALLWPDSEPRDAGTALRNALSLVRTLLDGFWQHIILSPASMTGSVMQTS